MSDFGSTSKNSNKGAFEKSMNGLGTGRKMEKFSFEDLIWGEELGAGFFGCVFK
eukprot:Pgem_evm1s17339